MLIKCPECGHQVSDKAPYCPNCGIEIAGHIHNYETTTTPSEPVVTEPVIEEEPVVEAQPIIEAEPIVEAEPYYQEQEHNEPRYSEPRYSEPQYAAAPQPKKPRKRKSRKTLWVSFFIAAILCAVMLYIYNDATEQLGADNVVNMDKLKNMQENVDSSLVDPTYSKRHMEDEASKKDEKQVANEDETNSQETEADEETDNKIAAANNLSNAEMDKATSAVRRFFQAINAHDKEALDNSVSPFLSTFNGKERATKKDVQKYMVDLYQADVKNINWYIGDIEKIEKREVGENRYEYDIVLEAKNVTVREGSTSKRDYIVKAMVENDGKIGAMSVKRK